MNPKVKKLGQNFVDGIYTGFNPISFVFHHIVKNTDSYLNRDRDYLIGYSADRYGVFDNASNVSTDTPKERSTLDQILKGIGTGLILPFGLTAGLALSVEYIITHYKGKDVHPEKDYEVPFKLA